MGIDGALRYCSLESGRIAYWEHGSGQPLVLVHGLFGDHLDWAPILEPLAQSHRVIALDLPGFGSSEHCLPREDAAYYVAQLEAFFGALSLERIVLVGNSLGGLLCGHYACAHPRRLAGLALVSAAGMREYSPEEQALAASRLSAENLEALRPEHIAPLFALNFARETPQREAYLEHQRGKLAWPDYAAYCQVLAACARMAFAAPLFPTLASLQLPVLLVWGDADPVFPLELAKEALPRLRQGRLALIHGASHMPQMDCPQETIAALAAFAEELAGRKAAFLS